jgi:hypothetical protein
MIPARASRTTSLKVFMYGRHLIGRCSARSTGAVFGATASEPYQDYGIAQRMRHGVRRRSTRE